MKQLVKTIVRGLFAILVFPMVLSYRIGSACLGKQSAVSGIV